MVQINTISAEAILAASIVQNVIDIDFGTERLLTISLRWNQGLLLLQWMQISVPKHSPDILLEIRATVIIKLTTILPWSNETVCISASSILNNPNPSAGF